MKKCYCGKIMVNEEKQCPRCGLRFTRGLPNGKSEPQNTLLPLDIEKTDKIFTEVEDEDKHR